MQRVFGLTVALGIIVAATCASAVDISSCGQALGEHEVGVLVADLSCPPATRGITMASGTTLDLNGHSIEAPDGWAIWCEAAARCTVIGNGATIRNSRTGVYLQIRARLTMNDVQIQDCHVGVGSEDWNNGGTGSHARLTEVTVTGSTGAALNVGRLFLEHVALTDNPGSGIYGVITNKVKAFDLTITGNAYSEACQINGCQGVRAGKFLARDVVITDNAGIGVNARLVRVHGGVISNNIRALVRKDIVSSRAPMLRDVACDRSVLANDPLSEWGVCRYDGLQQ